MDQEQNSAELNLAAGAPSTRWYLTGQIAETDSVQAIPIDCSPFTIGREGDQSLTLPRPAVSGRHAEIITEGESLLIKDLDSTNGTFKNAAQITQIELLEAGDLLQFADVTFRLNEALPQPAAAQQVVPEIEDAVDGELSLSDFDRFLRMRTVTPHFQPIVRLEDREVVGCEVLARSRIPGLATPKEMFLAASQLNLEEELSRILRLVGFEKGMMLQQAPSLFINTHTAEIATFGLLESLQRLRDVNPDQPITLEIREPVASETAIIRQFRDSLAGLKMGLAYDHFGFGKSRRSELMAIRPDYVKFDMELIREIHLAPAGQRALLANLVKMVQELGITSVAMGVECEAEHFACRELGFELGQGFFYGKPAAGAELSTGAPVGSSYV